MNENPTAAVLVIGNEILSGRTQEGNVRAIALRLAPLGIAVAEVRVVPDVQADIVAALNALRARYDHILTTGGIGPTHDDITAEAVAVAFEVPLEVNAEAHAILLRHYGAENLTEGRLRMARMPQGARLIANPASAAPGFSIGNVHVMAGVPDIMRAMLDGLAGTLKGGKPFVSRTVNCAAPESQLATRLGALAAAHAEVEIGSYPWFKAGGYGLALVMRGADAAQVDAAAADVLKLAREFDPAAALA